MRRKRFRFEFRMELATEEPRMPRKLDDFDKVLVGRDAGDNKTVIRQHLFELPVELIAMAMPFGNDIGLINAIGERTRFEIRRIGTETHRAADGVDAAR